MRKTVLILLFALSAGSLFAQHEKTVNNKPFISYEEAKAKLIERFDTSMFKHLHERYKPNITKAKPANVDLQLRSEVTKQRLDSVVWTGEDEYRVKYTIEYDNKGNLKTDIFILWYRIPGVEEYRKYETTYNSNGNPTEEVVYSWNSTAWVGRVKYENTYDNNENLTEEVGYSWNGTAWEENQKHENTYDSNENLTLNIFYSWNGTAWEENRKYEYTYDSDGNLTLRIFYLRNTTVLEKYWKYEATYDSNGNLMSRINYFWYRTAWVEIGKYEYTYDSNGNQTLYIEYSWNGTAWVESQKYANIYDSNGNQTMCIHYASGTWAERRKDEYVYDLSYTLNDIIFPEWLRENYFCWGNNKLTEAKYYGWTGYGWQETGTQKYYYSDVMLSGISNTPAEQSAAIRAYPNPTSGMVYTETERNIKVYNPQGSLLQETSGFQIDLSAYPQGLYFLHVEGQTVKIIKK